MRKSDEKKTGKARLSAFVIAVVALLFCLSHADMPVYAANVSATAASTAKAEAAKTGTTSRVTSAAAASTAKAEAARTEAETSKSASATASTTKTETVRADVSKVENEKATMAASDAAIDFSYVERDISNWEAVYEPVLEANGTLATIGGLPARASENYDVAVAAEKLYALLTDTRKTSSILRTDKALILYDVLNGNYSRKAVELFLDHGYFTDYFQDLRKAGLVDDTYRLPTSFYETIVQGEVVTAPVSDEKSSGTQTYRMIRTDSDYLGTWQLLVVARSARDKKTITSLEKKIDAFEENYVPKYRKP